MKPASILPLAVMLATTSMLGQSFTRPPRIDPSKCPVGLRVEHGLSYKWRIIPVSAPTPDIWKTVDVALDVKGNSSASGELSFDHFSTISTIDVNSVTYADGSTWHAPSPGACSVAPSLIMRISSQ